MRRCGTLYAATLLTALAIRSVPLHSQAAPDSPFEGGGFQQNRDYVSLLPFEHIDTLTGNLLLTFTDLTLPGNGGFDLSIQRTYNSKQGGVWRIGLAGIPMLVKHAEVEPIIDPQAERTFPILVTADGADHPAEPVAANNEYYAGTREFWRYRRGTEDQVELPNGLVGTYGFLDDRGADPIYLPYGNNVRYLTAVSDPFGNSLELSWTMHETWGPRLTQVVQHLGNGQDRTIDFESDDDHLIHRMIYRYAENQNRTWMYAYDGFDLASVTPPTGATDRWTYGYTDGDLTSVTLPQGGVVEYVYGGHVFNWRNMRDGNVHPITTKVVAQRTIGSIAWTYTYMPDTATPEEKTATVQGPFNTIAFHYRTVGEDLVIDRRTVTVGETELEKDETTQYHLNPFVDWGQPNPAPLPKVRTITRDGATWTTEHTYSAEHYGDFGQPNYTKQTGTAGIRETRRTFKHDFTAWIRGVITEERIAVGGQEFASSFTYDGDTGFRTSQTVFGTTTTFTPTAEGNVASQRHRHVANDPNSEHATSFSYSWGVVSAVDTPEYDMARTVYPSGLVESETRRNQTTRFEYDALNRATRVDPPAGDDTTTAYEATRTTVTRGASWVRTNMDGFGRPTLTENAAGVKTRSEYDVSGRETFQSYPYSGANDAGGDTFTYDGLDRVTRVQHADGSAVTVAYTSLTQTITDENGHATVQRWEAFGDPSAARLESLTDAANQTWRYGYNAVGSLTDVDAPGDHASRSWTYGGRNLLDAETHPESGQTHYTYDDAGRLATKTDARSREFRYHYDGNERLTRVEVVGDPGQDLRFTYDDSDNRRTLTSAGVATTVDYDGANRRTSRTDVMGTRSFTVAYDYDGRDNVTRVTYPSGRVVHQDYDTANRVTRVYESEAVVYAQGMTYHPNGALASYTAGNGITHTATLTDDGRQFVKNLDAAPVALTYGYDDVGNVTGIDDRSARNRDAAFGYDALDRLTSVAGFGAGSFTYDAYGNRRTKSGVTYAYDESTQRLTSDGVRGYGYDPNGNTTSAGGDTYGYSAFNLLTSATVDGVTTTYGYDADQQRRWRTTPTGTAYFVDGPGFVPLAEYTETNGTLIWQRDYVYVGARLIASLTPRPGLPPVSFTDDPLVPGIRVKVVHLTELRAAIDAARASYRLPAFAWTDPTVTTATPIRAVHVTELRTALNAAYAAAGTPAPSYIDPALTGGMPIRAVHVQEIRDARRTLPNPPAADAVYYHLDALGSVRAVTDAAGAVVRRHDYLAFGEEYEPEAGADTRRFTGKERDAETGLDYVGARYMSAVIGRFYVVDPISADASRLVNPQRLNRYAFSVSNPLRFADPSGLDVILVNFGTGAPISGHNFGHQGIVAVSRNGDALFADYGPLEPTARGPAVVAMRSLRVDFGADGLPTKASLMAVAAKLGRPDAPPDTIRLAYFRTGEAETLALKTWIEQQKFLSSVQDLPRYDFLLNNCADFARVGLRIGGYNGPLDTFSVPNWSFLFLRMWADATYQMQATVTTSWTWCLGKGCGK